MVEGSVMTISNKLFVCPNCGEKSLWLHKKTYENVVIALCSNCRLSYSFESTNKVVDGQEDILKEFKTSYGKTYGKKPIYV